MGYSRKNVNSGGGGGGRGEVEDMELWNFQGYQINSMCNFRGLIKTEVEFPRVTKKN